MRQGGARGAVGARRDSECSDFSESLWIKHFRRRRGCLQVFSRRILMTNLQVSGNTFEITPALRGRFLFGQQPLS